MEKVSLPGFNAGRSLYPVQEKYSYPVDEQYRTEQLAYRVPFRRSTKSFRV